MSQLCLSVDLQRVSEVCENRKRYGYNFVSEWISKDFFLIPDKTIITVDVKGKFGIPKECNTKHPKLSFIPVAKDNFTRFLVELKTSGTVYGVLSIRDNKSVLDEIFYDPASTIKLPPNRKIRDRLTGNRNDHLVISRSSTTGNRIGKGTADSSVTDKKDGIFLFVHSHIHNNKNLTLQFFTDKGLLALSKSMSPDTMLDVCINMDMTTSTFDTLQQKYGVGTTRGNIALWKNST
ncbi:unnamed protein product [Mytilus edulis]|uniref:Uncharacterized protein n=1 Tax=Mytilus edulis TaxID=6550 RepID=A0A8S3PXD9_MYTED|nr:unnamed protein product [Mytilus edulis]